MDSKRTWKNLGEKNQMKHARYKGTTSALEILCGVGGCKSILENHHSLLAFYSEGIHCCREKSGQDGLFPFIPTISLIYILTQILTWFRVISPIPHQLQVRNFMSIHRFLVALMLWEFWTFWLPALMLFLKENDSDAELKDPVL